MPVSLRQMATNTAHVTIPVGDGDNVSITYYPGRFTEKMMADVQRISSLDESTLVAGFGEFNKTLASLIKDWDVYDDDDMKVKFPVDAARFGELPLGFRMQIFNGIAGDLRPNEIAPGMTAN